MLNHFNIQKNIAYAIIALSTLILLFIAVKFSGTGDDGDSVQHYMFARWAFNHPENFFVQWAKPIYVLITAPLAQFGFGAIKIFNVFVFGATQFFAYATARKLNIKNPWLVPLFMILAPMEIYLTPSGLTEPMWALWFIISVYLAVSQRLVAATIFVSFLPFVRSEGLVMLCLFAPYLIVKKRYFLVPLLFFGHLVYMVAGAKYYNGDYLWVFTKMSYATLEGAYGSGTWTHFADRLREVMGGTMRLFLIIGAALGVWRLVQYWTKKMPFSKEELWLVYGCSAAYFVGHSAFWALGIFNSFGLMRVMIGIMPTFAILITHGYNLGWEWAKTKDFRLGWAYFLLTMIWIVYSGSRYFKKEFLEFGNDQLATQLALKNHSVDVNNVTLYFDNTSVAYFLGTDYFNDRLHRHTNRLLNGEPVPANALIFWDDWYSRSEFKVPLEKLQQDQRFKQLGNYVINGKSIYVFKRDTSIVKITNTLYNENFDTRETTTGLDTKYSFSGKYANLLDKKNPFSDGFEGILNSLKNKEGKTKVKVTCKLFIPEIKENQNPTLVSEVLQNGTIVSWKGYNVFEQIKTANQWVDFESVQEIVGPLDSSVKLYFWNDYDTPLYIDDFKIEIFD